MSRLTDRLRPWRAPAPPSSAPVAMVVGAGPAGLASAVQLRRAGVRARIVEAAEWIGGSWPTRYDSLRLNTVRWMSDLPGLRLERRSGRWVGRDDYVTYLRAYAIWHDLDVALGVTVERVDQTEDGRWSLEVGGEAAVEADAVVMTTGHSRTPVVPDWATASGFGVRVLHAGAYRSVDRLPEGHVVVVGGGSSGGEIVMDLVRAERRVTWSVRSAPAVVPREVAGVPLTPFGAVGDITPHRIVDAAMPRLERMIHGPRDYLPPPPEPLFALLERCKEPLTADGIVGAIRAGAVAVVPAVERLYDGGVELVDGSRVGAETVIVATGYRPALEGLVGHLGVLGEDGRPIATVPRAGLGFVGFRVPLAGTLWAIDRDARRVAALLVRPVP